MKNYSPLIQLTLLCTSLVVYSLMMRPVDHSFITMDITPTDVRISPEGSVFVLETRYKNAEDYSTMLVWNYTSLKNEKLCLAKNIYFEARNQPINGQIAVALVTINRVKSPAFPSSICEVVWQQGENSKGKLVAQFSWTLDGKPDVPADHESWERSYTLADAILGECTLYGVYDFTHGALFYHATYIVPSWSPKMDHVLTLYDHVFYIN